MKKEKQFIFRMCWFRGTCFVYELWSILFDQNGERTLSNVSWQQKWVIFPIFKNTDRQKNQMNRMRKLGFRVCLHLIKVSCRSLGRDLLTSSLYEAIWYARSTWSRTRAVCHYSSKVEMLISIDNKHLSHPHCFATVFYGLPIDQRRRLDVIEILGVRNGKRLLEPTVIPVLRWYLCVQIHQLGTAC